MFLAAGWQQEHHSEEESLRRGVSSSQSGLEGSLRGITNLKGTQQVLGGSVQLGNGSIITAYGSYLKSAWKKSFLLFPKEFKSNWLISQRRHLVVECIDRAREELERAVWSSFISLLKAGNLHMDPVF